MATPIELAKWYKELAENDNGYVSNYPVNPNGPNLADSDLSRYKINAPKVLTKFN